MSAKNKIINALYEIVIYVFPFVILFLLLVSFQLWKLENSKEKMASQLKKSNEMIEAARNEISAVRSRLNIANDSFSFHSTNFSDLSFISGSFPEGMQKKELAELDINVLNRVSNIKKDLVKYLHEDYIINEPTGKFYAVVISYSELGYAIIQREHLMSLGFKNIDIINTGELYALSIYSSDKKDDVQLLLALDKWDTVFRSHTDAFIKKF